MEHKEDWAGRFDEKFGNFQFKDNDNPYHWEAADIKLFISALLKSQEERFAKGIENLKFSATWPLTDKESNERAELYQEMYDRMIKPELLKALQLKDKE